jgi:O-methyltransferase
MNLEDFIRIVQPYSMTSVERIKELYNSLEYIRINNIDGDIVECGVWKGGNILGIIEYLEFHKIKNRNVWIYDTFEGMTPPDEFDVDHSNLSASIQMSNPMVLAKSSIDEVKENLSKSNFDRNKLKFIIGDVSETLTISENIPNRISILRLDTDWYKSTRDELVFLYPMLLIGGVLIVDDYGHWRGSKKAVDEYFENKNILIEKIDYTGIKIIKNI